MFCFGCTIAVGPLNLSSRTELGEIQGLTTPDEWRHVPGDTNPADLPTRGITASQLNDESTWPEMLSVADPKNVSPVERLDPRKYSSLRNLLRVTAWVHVLSKIAGYQKQPTKRRCFES